MIHSFSNGSVELDHQGSLIRLVYIRQGNPGEIALNSKLHVVRHGKRASIKPTPIFESHCVAMGLSIRRMMSAAGVNYDGRARKGNRLVAMFGPVATAMTIYWPRRYGKKSPEHLEGLPFGDVDAVHKAMFDGALEASGVLEDDGQIIEESTRKRFDKRNPRIACAVWRTEPEYD